MMEITMTKHAMEALTKKVGKDSKIALALIDSSDPFLRDKGACAKGSFFQIIPFFVETFCDEDFRVVLCELMKNAYICSDSGMYRI